MLALPRVRRAQEQGQEQTWSCTAVRACASLSGGAASVAEEGAMTSVVVHVIYITAFVMLYFTPSIIAFYRAKPSRLGIACLNLLTGWTTIGWLAAFVWACV